MGVGRKGIAAFAGLVAMTAEAFCAPPDFDPKFADGMVLQREAPVEVSGTADAGSQVSVSLGSSSARTVAGPDGRWQVTLAAQQAVRAATLLASTQQGAALRQDVHIGDVFLCSGQSNMAHQVSRALNPDNELAGPFSADIRLLKIPQVSSVAPRSALPAGTSWSRVTAASLSDFSALCWFFGRDIQAREGVPVGLIDASWGGSRIEPWMSAAALKGLDRHAQGLETLALYADDPAAAQRLYGAQWEAWWLSRRTDAPWRDGLSGAKPVPGPMRDWKTFGDPELASHLGMVWFEREFTLSSVSEPETAMLSLGGIDEIDSVWVNGVFIGTTFGWGTPRHYVLPAGTLREGTNRLSVSVFNGWGAGGMTGPDDAISLQRSAEPALPLGTGWTYLRVPPSLGSPPAAPWQSLSGLTGLHNAMLHPLSGLQMKGALWYQGESNTGEASAYEDLLRRFAADLRAQFGAELPLLVVQLPEFGARPFDPQAEGWSALREAQRRFVAGDPASGLIVALGAGDPWDIHPPNKQEVARRALSVWRNLTDEAVRTGHSPLQARRKGRSVEIDLPQAGAPYSLAGSDLAVGFTLCTGEGACRFASAGKSGTTLTLPRVEKSEVLVRYGWGDTPLVNIYAADGTPVTPFALTID